MKLFWTGTDSLMLVDYSMRTFRKKVYWWIFRRLIRTMDHFIEAHYCDAENIADNLRKFGTQKPIRVMPDILLHTEVYPKEAHNKFNVLYYFPGTTKDKEFTKWLYGWDIFLKVRKHFLPTTDVNFIIIDGRADMKSVFPVTDFYIRPNRHDGASRLIRECEIQNIPYFRTKTNPDECDVIKAIERAKKNNKV